MGLGLLGPRSHSVNSEDPWIAPICMHQEMDRVIPRISSPASLHRRCSRPPLPSAPVTVPSKKKIVCGGGGVVGLGNRPRSTAGKGGGGQRRGVADSAELSRGAIGRPKDQIPHQVRSVMSDLEGHCFGQSLNSLVPLPIHEFLRS